MKEPDWDAFYALVSSDEGKREIGSLRSAFNDTKKQLEKMGTVCSGSIHHHLPIPPSMHAARQARSHRSCIPHICEYKSHRRPAAGQAQLQG